MGIVFPELWDFEEIDVTFTTPPTLVMPDTTKSDNTTKTDATAELNTTKTHAEDCCILCDKNMEGVMHQGPCGHWFHENCHNPQTLYIQCHCGHTFSYYATVPFTSGTPTATAMDSTIQFYELVCETGDVASVSVSALRDIDYRVRIVFKHPIKVNDCFVFSYELCISVRDASLWQEYFRNRGFQT